VETDFVPDLRPGDDLAHEVLPTFTPDGAIMFQLSFRSCFSLAESIKVNQIRQKNILSTFPSLLAILYSNQVTTVS
jgi:hypothetical protein